MGHPVIGPLVVVEPLLDTKARHMLDIRHLEMLAKRQVR